MGMKIKAKPGGGGDTPTEMTQQWVPHDALISEWYIIGDNVCPPGTVIRATLKSIFKSPPARVQVPNFVEPATGHWFCRSLM